jgi:multicomponent Na+:H+ antiporter subunit G
MLPGKPTTLKAGKTRILEKQYPSTLPIHGAASLMRFIFDIFTVVLVSAGAFFFLAGTVGLLRFPDTLTRLHALTKADNLGLGLVVIGLLPRAGGLYAAKLIAVWLLVLVASSAVSQLIGRAARRGMLQK